MEHTTEANQNVIDNMLVDRIPAPDIAEYIDRHSNGNAESLRQYLHKRTAALPEDYLTDPGNGEAVAAAWGHMTRYVYEFKAWIIYLDGRWVLDTAGLMRRLAVKTMRRLYMDNVETTDPNLKNDRAKWYIGSENDKRVTAMLTAAATQPGMTIEAKLLDDKPWLLNVKNGTIDLKTCQLRPAEAADLLTQQIPIDFNPEAVSEEWQQFLMTMFDGDAELIDFIQRLIGYTANGTQDERVFTFLYGLGKNGKSQFTAALRRVFGPYALEGKPEMFMERKYKSDGPDEGQASLKGIRLFTASEVKRGQSLDVGLIKRMTGGEPIWHERKFQHGYSINPTHTLWLSGNHEPQIKDTTDSTWDRLIKICCDVRIKADKEIKAYGEKLADQYGEAILTWIITGSRNWLERGLNNPPESVQLANAEYRASQDALHDFIEARIRKEPGVNAFGKEVYASFVAYCALDDTEPMSKRAFNEAMRERGFKDRRGTDNLPTWIGITLSTQSTEKQESFLNARAREETFSKNGNQGTLSNFSDTKPEKPCPQCGGTDHIFDDKGKAWKCSNPDCGGRYIL